jgi:hypothetical protein
LLGKRLFVALSPGTPHCRTLRAVKHPELQGRCICDQTHHSTEGINLPNDLSFRYSADRRVAGHPRETPQVGIDEKNRASHIGGSHRRFTSGVASSYYDDVVFVLDHF